MSNAGRLPPVEVRDAILASSRDAIVVVDGSGAVVSWNEAAEALFGYTLDEMLGQDLHTFVTPPAYLRDARAGLARFAKDGTGAALGRTLELMGQRKGGETFPVELSLTAVEVGASRYAAAVVRDLRERRRLSDALFENVQLLVSLVEALPAPLMYCDRAGVIRGCNRAFEEFTGRSRAEVAGHPIDDIAPEDIAALCREKNDQLFGAPGHLQFEATFPTAGGRRRDVLFHKATWKGRDGLVGGVVTVLVDLTEHKQVEALLRREARLTGLETLARGVAHELNNPLAVVRSCAEVLRDLGLPADATTWLDYLDEAAARAVGIVSALLSQAAAEREPLAAGVDAGELAREAVAGVAARAVAAGASILVEIPAGLPTVACQRRAVGDVIAGLLENALEALVDSPGADGRPRTLRIAALARARDGHDEVRITIENNGEGIRPEHLERLFEPFFTTRSRATHRGLGLHVGRARVRENGGELSVEATPGAPTRFHLDLPAGGGDPSPRG